MKYPKTLEEAQERLRELKRLRNHGVWVNFDLNGEIEWLEWFVGEES